MMKRRWFFGRLIAAAAGLLGRASLAREVEIRLGARWQGGEVRVGNELFFLGDEFLNIKQMSPFLRMTRRATPAQFRQAVGDSVGILNREMKSQPLTPSQRVLVDQAFWTLCGLSNVLDRERAHGYDPQTGEPFMTS